MRLKQIKVENFKCFKEFSIDLPEGVSLLIGRNGAGKTSLVKAMVGVMHFIFTNENSMGDDYLSAGNPDLKVRSIGYDEFYRESIDKDVSAYANLHGVLSFENETLEWDMYRRSTPGSAIYPSKYLEAYRKFVTLYKQYDRLPLLAYFSDSFPHKEANISSFAKTQINSSENVLRNFGYYQWSNDNACTTIWQQRLVNAILKYQQIERKDDFSFREYEYVTSILQKFSQPTTDNSDPAYEIKKLFVAVDGEGKLQLWVRLASDKDLLFTNLPAGYLRLYSIVLDIAYRSFILNRGKVSSPVGIVFIDEIDLHLHPSLALEVVERLTAVFPNIQFVMSTHSPLVMARLADDGGRNKIFCIVSGKTSPIFSQDIYGIDYNTIISDYWGIDQKNEEVNFLVENVKTLQQMGRLDLAGKRKQELKKLIGEERYNKLMN